MLEKKHFNRFNTATFSLPVTRIYKPWLGWLLWNICITNDHGYIPFVVNNSQSFPHWWLITGFVIRLTRRVSLVEQKMPTFPVHLSSPPIFSEVCVTRSLVLCLCFVDRCLSFSTFPFAIVLSVLRFTEFDYLFGIFKLFFRDLID